MSKENVLAVVAGKEITEQEFELFLNNVPADQKRYASNPKFREHYLEQLVHHHLFAELGAELKLDETEDFIAIIENAKRDVLAQMAMVIALKGTTDVTDEEAKAYYDEHQDQFQLPETVTAKHILVADEETCKAVLASIESGEKTFEDAARESSTCPSGQAGGDLGAFSRGQMVKEFEDVAFAAEVGKICGPVQTQFGYHLIKVEEKKEASVSPFENEKAGIVKKIVQEKQTARYAEKVAELKEKYLEE